VSERSNLQAPSRRRVPGALAHGQEISFCCRHAGIDPATNKLVEDPQARTRRAFINIKTIAGSEGASLKDCVRLTVYLSELPRFAPMVEKAQAELWGGPPYACNDDIAEIDSVFYAPVKKLRQSL
jgi:2-iminobutanoate/2-iminopropanoate deaminase